MKGVKTENTSDFSINSELSTSELEISQDEIMKINEKSTILN